MQQDLASKSLKIQSYYFNFLNDTQHHNSSHRVLWYIVWGYETQENFTSKTYALHSKHANTSGMLCLLMFTHSRWYQMEHCSHSIQILSSVPHLMSHTPQKYSPKVIENLRWFFAYTAGCESPPYCYKRNSKG